MTIETIGLSGERFNQSYSGVPHGTLADTTARGPLCSRAWRLLVATGSWCV
jgi:hypothetical protein